MGNFFKSRRDTRGRWLWKGLNNRQRPLNLTIRGGRDVATLDRENFSCFPLYKSIHHFSCVIVIFRPTYPVRRFSLLALNLFAFSIIFTIKRTVCKHVREERERERELPHIINYQLPINSENTPSQVQNIICIRSISSQALLVHFFFAIAFRLNSTSQNQGCSIKTKWIAFRRGTKGINLFFNEL